MRVLIATQADRSHFFSMVVLAWAIRTSGHEVRVASQPQLADAIADSGLTAVPVGRDHHFRAVMRRVARSAWPQFDMTVERSQDATWEHVKEGYRRTVSFWWRLINESMISDLTAFCREWRPDLVIWEATTFAGAIAAKASGAAHARFLWSVDLFTRMRAHYLRLGEGRPPGEREDLMADWLGSHMVRYGGAFSEDMTHGQFTIDYVPGSMRLDTGLDYLTTRYVPYNGLAVVPSWLRTPPERPRVCVTLGNSWASHLGRYDVPVREMVEALGDLDIELVATLPEAQQERLGRLPDNVRLVSYVPLHALAPTCSAVINQGGPGTLFTTAFYGVPQLVLHYHWFDEPLLARGVADNEAGLAIPSGEVTGDKVRDSVIRILKEPAYQHGADRLRREIHAMPSPNDVIPELEKRAEQLRP